MRDRMEDGDARREGNVLAVEELAEGGIVGDADRAGGGFEREMEVADLPTEAGGGGGVGRERDFEDGLGLLGEDVGDGFLAVDDVAIVEVTLEVEAEFAAVGGNRAPASLREVEAVGGHRDFQVSGGFGGGVVDEDHEF